jgi:hypothetical protein
VCIEGPGAIPFEREMQDHRVVAIVVISMPGIWHPTRFQIGFC